MKILHVDFDDLGQPWAGGQARRTFEVNRRLAAERGWSITVVTGSYDGARPLDHRLPRGRLAYRRAGGGRFPLNFLSFVLSLPLVARRYPHDVLVEDFTPPIGPALCPRWTGRPVVGSAQFLFAGEMSRKYRLPFQRVERWALRRYRHFVALGQSGADYLRRYSPGAEVAVIPQGLDAGDFADPATIDGGGEHVLYLGRLDLDQKGLDTLLQAWSLLPAAERPPLVLAGSGRDRGRVEQLASALDLTSFVRLAGRVAGSDKHRLVRDARFVCVPSRYETYGMAAIEALAAGKPVVASDIPGLREAAAAGAVLVPPSDPPSLAGAVQRLWSDWDCRVHLGRSGRGAVSHLTWDNVAAQQASFYERVLDGFTTGFTTETRRRGEDAGEGWNHRCTQMHTDS